MKLDDLRDKISRGEYTFEGSPDIIETGEMIASSGLSDIYEIHHGWDIVTAHACDVEWGAYNLSLLGWIKSQDYSDDEIRKVLKEVQFQDSHWEWFKKALIYTTDEYDWFFLFADNKPQGACLMYHPKESTIDSQDIFYIEFIAVAPWNRDSPKMKRIYRGVGSILIGCAWELATTKLGLADGFSLHSLPEAAGYYSKLGMAPFPGLDKGTLKYFEMPRNEFGKKR